LELIPGQESVAVPKCVARNQKQELAICSNECKVGILFIVPDEH